MTLTIKTAMEELPILSTLEVVAGHGGINNIINWTHIVDQPDMIPFVRPGMLLLSTAFGISQEVESQKRIIQILSETGLAGMIISIGKYFEEIPDAMIEEADRLNFPLIRCPWNIPYVDITYAINGRIIREQISSVEDSIPIQKELTQLVIDNGGLTLLAERLSNLVGNSVEICDRNQEVLVSYHYQYKSLNQESFFSVEEKKAIKSIGLLYFSRINPTIRYIKKDTHKNINFEMLLSPIYISDQVFGYIWILGTDKQISEFDYAVMEQGTTIAALIASRDLAIHNAELRGKREIFESLMTNDFTEQNSSEWYETAKKLGLREKYQVLIIKNLPFSEYQQGYIYSFVDYKIKENNVPGTVFEYGNYVVIILTNILQFPAEKTAEYLFREAEIRKIKIVAGISRVASNIQDFKFFLEEAIESLQIGQAMYRSKPTTWSLSRLGFFYTILKKGTSYDEKNHYCEIIKQIEAYDIQHKTEYLKTMTVYLENLMDAKKTSSELYIHRNTLRQRIQKIMSDWDIDFSDSIAMINLLIAIKSTLVCSFYTSDTKNDQGNIRNPV